MGIGALVPPFIRGCAVTLALLTFVTAKRKGASKEMKNEPKEGIDRKENIGRFSQKDLLIRCVNLQWEILEKLDLLSVKLEISQRREVKLMATLDEVFQEVQDQGTVEDSLIELTKGIKQQLDDYLKGKLRPEDQAKVDSIFTNIDNNSKKVADAIVANTPNAGGGTPNP